jgi:hypothetical protein
MQHARASGRRAHIANLNYWRELMKKTIFIFAFISIITNMKVFADARVSIEEGFIDIDFHITSYKTDKNGTVIFEICDKMNGTDIGFLLEIDNEWNIKPIENVNGNFYWGSGRICFTGDLTDEFIKQLSDIYKMQYKIPTRNNINVIVLGLASDPRLYKTQFVHTKFFLNPDTINEDNYAEIFVNIDIENMELQFHEKDSDYRQSLINALCGDL